MKIFFSYYIIPFSIKLALLDIGAHCVSGKVISLQQQRQVPGQPLFSGGCLNIIYFYSYP
jgi:hypothetical protein